MRGFAAQNSNHGRSAVVQKDQEISAWQVNVFNLHIANVSTVLLLLDAARYTVAPSTPSLQSDAKIFLNLILA